LDFIARLGFSTDKDVTRVYYSIVPPYVRWCKGLKNMQAAPGKDTQKTAAVEYSGKVIASASFSQHG